MVYNNKHRSVLISVGTELTEGYVQDIYLKYFGSLLKNIGFLLKKAVQIPDCFDFIQEELAEAVCSCETIFITGGLGPTSDDITSEVVAAVAEKELVFRPVVWQAILDRFKGRPVAESNKKQAMIPDGFSILENSGGTAPGFYGFIKNCLVFVLPGPPGELKPILEDQVLPVLSQKFQIPAKEYELICSVFALSESSLETFLRESAPSGVSWQTRLDFDKVILTLKSNDKENVELGFSRLRERTGLLRLCKGNVTISSILFNVLKNKKKSISFAESCTGGLMGKLITDLPGSSTVFPGGFVVYSNEAKAAFLGVKEESLERFGAVSKEVVKEMAEGALKAMKTDYSIAVSGIAGPGGGSEEKPVGTVWMGIAGNDIKTFVIKYNFSGDRNRIRVKTAITAFLNMEALILDQDSLDIIGKW